jgi:hypothetical protein
MRGPRTGSRWVALLAATAAAAALAAASSVAAGGSSALGALRLDDGSVGCRLLDAGTLACRGAGRERAVVLAADGSSRAGDVAVDPSEDTPVLLSSESWWQGAFSCRVRAAVVTCTAGGGAITVAPGAVGGVR